MCEQLKVIFQLIFTYSNSRLETLEKGVKYVRIQQ